MDNKVKCDNCDEMIDIKIKSKKVGIYKSENVRFNYFNCSKCGKKYFVGVKEKQLNKMTAKLRRLQKKVNALIGSGDVETIEKLQDECRQLQIEIRSRSMMLKQLFVLK